MLKEQNIEPGWSGIFVTCIRGREKQCEREMQELFKEVSRLDVHFGAIKRC